MLKERDIPQAMTSARAAARCEGLGAVDARPGLRGRRRLARPVAPGFRWFPKGRQRQGQAKAQSYGVFPECRAQAKILPKLCLDCRKPMRHPASIALTENLKAGGTGANDRLGDPNEKPMFDDARDCGQTVRQTIRIANGAKMAIHDKVAIVGHERLAAGIFAQADFALAA